MALSALNARSSTGLQIHCPLHHFNFHSPQLALPSQDLAASRLYYGYFEVMRILVRPPVLFDTLQFDIEHNLVFIIHLQYGRLLVLLKHFLLDADHVENVKIPGRLKARLRDRSCCAVQVNKISQHGYFNNRIKKKISTTSISTVVLLYKNHPHRLAFEDLVIFDCEPWC